MAGLALMGGTPIAMAQDYANLNTASQMVSDPEIVYVTSIDAKAREQVLDRGWKFVLGDQTGAQAKDYDDSKWKDVTLPHDYSIEQPFTRSGEAESGYLPGGVGWYRKSVDLPADLAGKRINLNFDGVYMDATIYVNGTQLANHPYGYTPFSVDITDAALPGQTNVIAVRVNHQTPSSRWYSGSGIYRDVDLVITDTIHVGYNGVQVTAPRIDSYTHGSILDVSTATKVYNEGADSAAVTVRQSVTKQGDTAELANATSALVTLAAGASQSVTVPLKLSNPTLWSVENPALYTVKTEVLVDDAVVDTQETTTGFRSIRFDPNTGFYLNGEPVKLKGVSMHHDQGALGAKAYRRAIERQVEILQKMGVNAIRTTHNPASRDLIEIANEKGMILIEEIFDGLHCAKNGNSNDYARFFNTAVPGGTQLEEVASGSTWSQFDLESTLRRDRNAPSIIAWSLGNEISEGTSCGMGAFAGDQANMITWSKAMDPTRPFTRGDNKVKSGEYNLTDTMVKAGGLAGVNYVNNRPTDGINYDTIHANYPDWPIYGAETASAVNSRGVYDRTTNSGQTGDKQLTSYDGSAVGWGAVASKAWYDTITRDFVAGEFVWTGFDYIGEPTFWNGIDAGAVGSWPSPKNSYFGIVDTAGFPKDSFYLYQSQWNDAVNTLHILPAWNADILGKKAGDSVKVVVYSDAPTVELYFTPKGGAKQLIGAKSFTQHTTDAGYSYQLYEGPDKSDTDHENLYLSWQVPYQDGTLEAVAKDATGKVIADTQGRNTVTTAGPAAKLKVSVDRSEIAADGQDLAYVSVDVVDADGNLVPTAANPVTFSVTGNGTIEGTDNGQQADHTSYLSDTRNAYHGQVLGIAKSTNSPGSFTVMASAPGLPSQSVTVTTTGAASADPQQLAVDHYTFPRNYYVKVGNRPVLPSTVDATTSDASVQEVKVTWDPISASQFNSAGSFVVKGVTEKGDPISVNVTMIDAVVAVLNYSDTTPVGAPAILPSARPGVIPDGTVLATRFPVEWDAPADTAYDKAGTVEIDGKATVFGQEYPVTATIRVQAATVTVGANVAPAALSLTQDVPTDKQSDTLGAIRNGATDSPYYGGGDANPNIWTNYKNSQAGDNTAEIVFEYATQQNFKEFDVYFVKDSYSARYPDPETTKWQVSDDGMNWKDLDVTETIGSETDGNVTPYKYDFQPTTATFVKLIVTNKDETLSGRKPCTGISEVELKLAEVGAFAVNDAAGFANMSVNGTALTNQQLGTWAYQTPGYAVTDLQQQTLENAAVTILPEYDKVVRLIVESEDHKTMKTFEIELGKAPVLEPSDASRDVPVADTSVEVDNFQPGNGKEKVLDNSQGTLWHTNWSQNVLGSTVESLGEKGWIALILDKPTDLEALRYLPRNTGGNNGRITGYKVYVSDTTDPQGATQPDGVRLPAADQYKLVSSGDWANDAQWKVANFNETAKGTRYVLLKPTASITDQAAQFVSAAEIRLRKAAELPPAPDPIDISGPDNGIKLAVAPATVTVDQVDVDHPALPSSVTVKAADGAPLVQGVDYTVAYAGNTEAGTAIVTVTGRGKYTGSLSKNYTIKLKEEPVLESVAVKKQPTDTEYTEGEHFNPAGLEITLTFSDGHSEDVIYGTDTAERFSFDPALDAELTTDVAAVNGSYDGKRFSMPIRVAKKPAVLKDATAVAPEAGDPASCTVKPTVVIPQTEGVQYFMDGDPVAAGASTYGYGQTVVITAQALEGYKLTNADFEAKFTSPTWADLGCQGAAPVEPGPVEPAQPSISSPSVPQTPDTGSHTAVAGLIALAMMAAGAVLVARRKRA